MKLRIEATIGTSLSNKSSFMGPWIIVFVQYFKGKVFFSIDVSNQ